MTPFIDTHAHYTDEAFDTDREELLEVLPDHGVFRAVTVGSCMDSSRRAVALSHRFPHLYAAVGVHPGELDDVTEQNFSLLADWMADDRVVALGEMGLDYHYEDGADRETQLYWLEKQLALAKELSVPVIFHDRDAHEDTLAVLRKYRPSGVVHCFSGSVEMAEEILRLGMYIGLSGATTFKNAKKPLAVAAAVPADRLVLETDCPYMAPVPFRGHRNDSTLIPHIAAVIAAVRGVTADRLLAQTADNAKALFPKLK